MTAGVHDITIEKGATFQLTVVYKLDDVVVDISGYSARMQVRRYYNSTTADVDIDDSDYITITGAEGKLEIAIPPSITGALSYLCGVYDIEIESAGGVVTRLLQGEVTISPEVTR